MLSRVVFLADFSWGYFRGVSRGIAMFATAQARNAWIPMVARADATDVLDDRANRNIIGVITIEGRGMDHAIKLGLPTVCISGLATKCPIPRVHSDDFAIGTNAAEHLMSTGVRNFAYFGGSESIYFSGKRYNGFNQQLRKNGHGEVNWLCTDSLDQPGVCLRNWLANLAKPVGILASCDIDGARVIAGCREVDLRVPEDVAVVGVDNDDVICESTYPTLSSIPHELVNVGYQAASILMSLIKADKAVPALTLVPSGPIVVRGSSDGLLMADPLVREAAAYLRRHFADGIKIQTVADAVCVCRKTLDMRFKAAMGYTPGYLLSQLQLNHAKRLLQNTDLGMFAVSTAAGFSSPRRFSQSFHHRTGLTPTEFRRKHRTFRG